MTCYHCCQPGHMRRDCPRRQRPHGTEAEHANQPDMQGTFYTCICFLMHHSLGCGVRVDMIGWDCELEISEILLMVDPRD